MATGQVEPGQTIAITVTGHGLKDVDTPMAARPPQALAIPVDAEAAAEALGVR
jgi:threonine synthase